MQVHKLLRLWDDLSLPELVANLPGGSEPLPCPVFGQGGLQQPRQSPGTLLLQRILAGKHQQSSCHFQDHLHLQLQV